MSDPSPDCRELVSYRYINEMVMPVKYKGILIIIFGIYTRCEQMKVNIIINIFKNIDRQTFMCIYQYLVA